MKLPEEQKPQDPRLVLNVKIKEEKYQGRIYSTDITKW